MSFFEQESNRQKAEAWDEIVKLLHVLTPGWLNYPGSGQECALKAIEGLAKVNDKI